MRRRVAASAKAGWASTWILRIRSNVSASARSANATAICSTSTARSPARMRTPGRCGFSRPFITRWAGLWVDYNLMSNLPGLHVLGEANFSDHGANRLGASALMQGLADGYFVLPYTIPVYLAEHQEGDADVQHDGSSASLLGAEEAVREQSQLNIAIVDPWETDGDRASTASWDSSCGTNAAWPARRPALKEALQKIPALREEFWQNVNVPGGADTSQPIARAGWPRGRLPRIHRVNGAATLCNAPSRAGGISARKARPPDGEALRDDENFAYVSRLGNSKGWAPSRNLHKEPLSVRKGPPCPTQLQITRAFNFHLKDELAAENLASA